MGSGSAWTARVLGATTSSSSGSGDRSSTRRSTSELTAPSPRPVLRSAGISTSTTHADRIRALTGGRRIEPTSPSCRRSRRPEPGRPSTYQSGKPVPTNRASSALGLAATSVALGKTMTAQAADPLAGDGTSPAPGVVVRTYGEQPSLIPGFKTVSMRDVILQPGAQT